jgi:glycosyltransferase involved in cell wall biosynthesis
MPKQLCIVIPCYNEENRLQSANFERFLNSFGNTSICFVNDGSTDGTLELLKNIKSKFDERTHIVTYDTNLGKAEAIRMAVIHCNGLLDYDYIAYLDADLSTSLEECVELTNYLDGTITFVFGSRIMRIGSTIVRRSHRFLIGRIIATIISRILGLKVYDTQCGCKIFTRELSEVVFEEPFVSTWLFDVEIFHRFTMVYGRKDVLNRMLEVPLKRWVDIGKSKVKTGYFIQLWIDLYRINRICKKENAILIHYNA